MKLTIETESPEVLVSGLSQAVHGYGQIIQAIIFSCDIPRYMYDHFEKMGLNEPEEQEDYCKKRFLEMKTMYEQLIDQIDTEQTKP